MGLLDIISLEWMGKPLELWLLFLGIVLLLLAFDLGVLNRRDHEIGIRESLALSAFYIAVSVAFGVWVWQHFGAERGEQFFTGYLIEKTLSLDNVFVMSLIFAYVGVPRALQHRVLFWGILGVLALRGLMIAGGAALVSQFEWVLYIFGAFLVATGAKMMISDGDAPDISRNPLLRLMRRLLRITPGLRGHHFFVTEPHPKSGRPTRYATPLFLALVLVEGADVIFAVDSVPAIFVITTDPYIIYTSNIFAVLGLRALYFAIAAVMHRFQYLKYAMALILIFIGGKIFAAELLGLEKIPGTISLAVTAALILGGIGYSLWQTCRAAQQYSTLHYRDRVFVVHQQHDDENDRAA